VDLPAGGFLDRMALLYDDVTAGDDRTDPRTSEPAYLNPTALKNP
jgi:hypothetical protein